MTDLKNIVQNREIIYDVFNVTISVVIICNLKRIHSSGEYKDFSGFILKTWQCVETFD